MKHARILLRSLLAAALLPVAAAALHAAPRVVILGFDGADAKLTQRWMAEGKLPNLAKLRDQGTFSPLRSTVPSQTPVSWSTFATGLNPGRHAIFDFLKRDTKTYHPSFAAFDETSEPFLWGERTPWILGLLVAGGLALVLFLFLKVFRRGTLTAGIAALAVGSVVGVAVDLAAAKLLPTTRPVAINRQQGDTFWKILGQAGRRVRVMRMPVTFPPAPYPHGEMLAGLGTPDLSFRIGKPFYFTSELFYTPKGSNEFATEVKPLVDNKGTIPTEITEPPDKLFAKPGAALKYISIPMVLTVAEDRSRLDIEVSGSRLSLKPGEWSDWVRFTFPFNVLIKLHGIGRFRLIALDPEVKLYLSPIQFDPQNLPPIVDISTPRGFAPALASRFGLYKTMGWTIDTWSIASGNIDEAIFFEDVNHTVEKERQMLDGLLADDWDVYVHYFEFTDRVQHVMWRFFDPKHPGYTPAGGAKWGGSILKAYEDMDAIVGEVMQKMPRDAVLFVVSDHGFASWRRTINYNTWLAEQGYLVLKGAGPASANLQMLFDQGEFFVNVDWSKSKAYAMGLGDLYINVKGREAQGIVEPGAEYDALVAELRGKLEGYVDAETGEHPVAHVYTRDEAYGTYDPLLIPDMFLSNSEGYRVGWQDSLGIIAKQVMQTNTDVWSGDHCSVYPPLVDGILFSNHPLSTGDHPPYIGDMTPTILDLYGVASPVKLDGKSLWPK